MANSKDIKKNSKCKQSNHPHFERSRAKARGDTRYFTGKPCPKGHIVERMVSTGHCIECLKLNKQKPKYLEKERARARKKTLENYYKDPEKALKKQKEYAKQNKEKIKQRRKRYYLENKDKVFEKNKEWVKNNEDKVKEYKRIWAQERRAKKVINGGSHTRKEALEILNKQKHKCLNCGCKLTDRNRHKDHIYPISKGGSNDISNIQWLCAMCNIIKNAKDPIEWAQENGRLL